MAIKSFLVPTIKKLLQIEVTVLLCSATCVLMQSVANCKPTQVKIQEKNFRLSF